MSVAASLLLLALALAADCFAVAIVRGAAARARIWSLAITLALSFGVAQGLAALIGWSLGATFHDAIAAFDHWIAFVLLAGIGAKMIYESLSNDPPGDDTAITDGALAILGLSIATSIDAAAAGFTLPALGAPVAVSVLAIGGVSFLATLSGVWIGHHGASKLGRQAELVGGLVLIAIGVKVLIEHQAFG